MRIGCRLPQSCYWPDTETTCEPKAANDDVDSRLGLGFGLGLGFVGALTTLSASSVFGIPVPPYCGGRSVARYGIGLTGTALHLATLRSN